MRQYIDVTQWIIPDLPKKRPGSQIENFILEKIKSNAIQPGEPIPAHRILARINKVDKKTVLNTYQRLAGKSWLNIKPGGNTCVSCKRPIDLMRKQEGKYGLAGQHRCPLNPIQVNQPKNALRLPFVSLGSPILNESCSPADSMARYKKQYRQERLDTRKLQKTPAEIAEDLHASVYAYLNTIRMMDLMPEELLVMHGYYEALRQLVKLTVSGGTSLVNASRYDIHAGFIFQDCAVNVCNLDPAAADFLERLQDLLVKKTISALYIRPGSLHPNSRPLQAHTCKRLIQMAVEHRFYILECDDDHEFWYGQQPFKPLWQYPNQGRVIYCAALSRLTSYLQNVRTILAPESLLKSLRRNPLATCLHRNLGKEYAVTKMLRSGELAEHIRNARTIKKRHLNELLRIIDENLKGYVTCQKPENGLSIWLDFQTTIKLPKVLKLLSNRGIKVLQYPQEQLLQEHIRHMRIDFSDFDAQEYLKGALQLQHILKGH